MNRLPFRPLVCLFAVLSLTDFALTWWLIEHSGRHVYEDNPVANQFLNQFGWFGLGVFKAAMVIVVIVVTSIVARRRPRAARHLLRFACAAVAFVILHGIEIGQTAETLDESCVEYDENLEFVDVNHDSHKRAMESIAYYNQIDRVCDDLVTHKSTLAEAVNRLESSELTQDPLRRKAISMCHLGKSFRQSLALQIIYFVHHKKTTCVDKETEPRLKDEYAAMFVTTDDSDTSTH